MRVPIGVAGVGIWGRVQVGGGGCLPVENEGKRGKGVGRVGGGLGTGTATGKPMRTRFSKLPSSKVPLSFSPTVFKWPAYRILNCKGPKGFKQRGSGWENLWDTLMGGGTGWGGRGEL